MEAIVKDGKLVVTIDLETEPTPSASGKTLIVASTHGNQATTAKVKVKGQDKPLIVSVNAYVKP